MSHDLGQLQADVNWQIAKGYLKAVVAVHGARESGGGLNEVQTKYEVMNEKVQSFIADIESSELNL